MLRMEDGYWEQLTELASELTALRHEHVSVNALIREALIIALELKPLNEIEAKRDIAREKAKVRLENIHAKIVAGQASELSARDLLFFSSLHDQDEQVSDHDAYLDTFNRDEGKDLA